MKLSGGYFKGRPIKRIYRRGQIIYDAGESPYIPEVQALFDRMDQQLDTEDKDFINSWYPSAKPYLDKMDLFYCFPYPSLNQCLSSGKLMNWPDAAYDGTLHGAVDFIPNKGLKGNGTDFYVETGWLPAEGTNYQQDSGSVGVAASTNGGNVVRYETSDGRGRTMLGISQGATSGNYAINRGSTRVFNSAAITGQHIVASRLGTTESVYRDAVMLDTNETTPHDPKLWTTGSFLFWARYRPVEDVIDFFSPFTASCIFVGQGFSEEDIENWLYILNDLLAYFGAEEKKTRPVAYYGVQMSGANFEQESEITYSLTCRDSGTKTGSVDIEIEGDLSDSDFDEGFLTSLAAAVAITDGVALDGSTLTFDETFTGELTWSRQVTSDPDAGQVHAVRLTNAATIQLESPFACQVAKNPAVVTPDEFLPGVNISGGEFGTPFYISNPATVDPYEGWGAKVIRLPCLWQRMQEELFGPLSSQAAQYKAGVEEITSRGIYCIVEPHNYGQYDNDKQKIGSPQVPVAAFVDFWEKFAAYFGNNPYVIYNLMNEPNGMDVNLWRSAAKSATDAIRAKGYFNQIQVPGTSYTGAHSWISSGNAARFIDFADPVNNFIFEMHQYLDPGSDGSGADAGTCSVNSHQRLNSAIGWCRDNGFKFFLGEYSAGDPAVSGQEQCGTEFPALLNIINANKDVISGTSAWGAGPWWNSTYVFRFTEHSDNTVLTAVGAMIVDSWSVSEFSPSDISDLVLWLDAADEATITESGGAVSAWADKSGDGNDAAQSTAAQRPLTGEDTINGLNVITFDGANDRMALPSALYGVPAGGNTLFVVAASLSSTGSAKRIITGQTGTSTNYGSLILPDTNSHSARSGATLNQGITIDSDPHIMAMRRDGSNIWNIFDGSSLSNTNAASVTLTELNLGHNNSATASQALDGYIAEVLIYERALTNGEINLIGQYLADKWDLTWNTFNPAAII